MVPWTDKAKKILLKYWNFDTLKDKQFLVINEILAGNDVVGLLPTGYGKSLCYLLPALLTKKTIFIISPLISLMDDQKDKLMKMGILSCALHSNNLNKNDEIKKIIEGKIKIVYMSPEYIIEHDGMELAKILVNNNQLKYLAIDESHCLSSWGHDFRPNYLKLKYFKELFPSIPIMAVTATAKDNVVNEIIKFLDLKNPKIIKANFDRPNLYIECKPIPKKIIKNKEKQVPYSELIHEYISKYKNDKIIIYVTSRKETEKISNELNLYYTDNISSPYHAGFNKTKRDMIQTNFIENKCKIIISTVAFGMGIDQIVRCVIILGCPSSIDEYYQQIGRAGRDGLQCDTILYYDASKKKVREYMINQENKTNKILINSKIENLKKVQDYAYSKKCRRQFILEYFGLSNNYFENNTFICNNCDNCIKYNLYDITNYIWDHFIDNKKLNIKLLSLINTKEFNIYKVLEDWKNFIKLNNYNIDNLPDNLKIKLRLPANFFENENEIMTTEKKYDLLYDKYESLI